MDTASKEKLYVPPPNSHLPKEENEETGTVWGEGFPPFLNCINISESPKISPLPHFSHSRSVVYLFRKFQRPLLHSQDHHPCKSLSTLINFSKSPQILNFDSMARCQLRVRASKLARLVNSEDSMA